MRTHTHTHAHACTHTSSALPGMEAIKLHYLIRIVLPPVHGYALPPSCFTASWAGLPAKLYSRSMDVWNIFSSLLNTIFLKWSFAVIIILEDLMLRLIVDLPRSHPLMFCAWASGQGSRPIYHCIPHGWYSEPSMWC